MLYQIHHLQDTEKPGAAGLVALAHTDLHGQAQAQGAGTFGVFTTLLGLAGNEIYLVTSGPATVSLTLPPGVIRVAEHTMAPTIRPVNHRPLSRPGVYVFRWFAVAPENIEEIIRLSRDAWPAFEANFEAQVQGFFTEAVAAPTRMLLITWYGNLAAWEASRHPPDHARENFLKRHRLTRGALPVATLLAPKEAGADSQI